MTNIGSRSLNSSIRILKRIKNWLGSIRTVGLRGFPSFVRRVLGNTSAQYISHEVDDLSVDNLLFRYATCNDMISLMGRYPQYCLWVFLPGHVYPRLPVIFYITENRLGYNLLYLVVYNVLLFFPVLIYSFLPGFLLFSYGAGFCYMTSL